MTNNRKQVILEKLAAKTKVIGMLLPRPKGAEAYLQAKAKVMPWSKMLKRTKDSTGTAMYRPDPGKAYQAFPIVGGKEAKRLKTVVN
jgi:hypothetical protein